MSSRLALVAGASALTALLVRGPLAERVGSAVAPSVRSLAEGTNALAPTSDPTEPAVDVVENEVAIEPGIEAPPPVRQATPAKPIKTLKSKPKPVRFVITQKELEAGVAARGWGARAFAVKDGLELHSVGRFARFGVAEGDVLVSANGYSLRTADDALAALGKLGDSRSIVVVLRRGAASYAVPLELVEE